MSQLENRVIPIKQIAFEKQIFKTFKKHGKKKKKKLLS